MFLLIKVSVWLYFMNSVKCIQRANESQDIFALRMDFPRENWLENVGNPESREIIKMRKRIDRIGTKRLMLCSHSESVEMKSSGEFLKTKGFFMKIRIE